MRLSAAQRMDMTMKGLSPLDENAVKAYIQNNGRIAAPLQEKTERAKQLVGESTSLGSGNESDRDYNQIPGYNDTYGSVPSSKKKSFKEELNEDLDDYAPKTMSRAIESSQLLSLRKNNGNNKRQLNEGKNIDYLKKGYDLSIEYLNAFIVNLQTPLAKNRIQLYSLLKKVMEYETKLKEYPEELKRFRSGCSKADKEMYSQIA